MAKSTADKTPADGQGDAPVSATTDGQGDIIIHTGARDGIDGADFVISATPETRQKPARPDFLPEQIVDARALVPHEAIERMHRHMALRRDSTAGGAEAVGDIIAQILNAETVDDVLADTEVRGLSEWEGKRFWVNEVKYNESDYDPNGGWYAVANITDVETGWRGPATSGAAQILAQFMRFDELDAYPVLCTLTKATKKPTAQGFWPLKLSQVK